MPDSAEKTGAERAGDILLIAPDGLKSFLQKLDAMKKLRARHKDARITLLVPPALVDCAGRCRYFDEIVADRRAALGVVAGAGDLFLKFRRRRFSCVYDLRGDARGARALLRHVLRGRPPFLPPPPSGAPDMAWLTADVSAFGVKPPYVLLLAGVSPRHPARGWSASRYIALALRLARDGFQPVVIGLDADAGIAERLTEVCPAARDLCGLTSVSDLAALARGAAAAVGNDTGATYLAALAGCPTQTIDADNPADISVNAIYRAMTPRKETGDVAQRCGTDA